MHTSTAVKISAAVPSHTSEQQPSLHSPAHHPDLTPRPQFPGNHPLAVASLAAHVRTLASTSAPMCTEQRTGTSHSLPSKVPSNAQDDASLGDCHNSEPTKGGHWKGRGMHSASDSVDLADLVKCGGTWGWPDQTTDAVLSKVSQINTFVVFRCASSFLFPRIVMLLFESSVQEYAIMGLNELPVRLHFHSVTMFLLCFKLLTFLHTAARVLHSAAHSCNLCCTSRTLPYPRTFSCFPQPIPLALQAEPSPAFNRMPGTEDPALVQGVKTAEVVALEGRISDPLEVCGICLDQDAELKTNCGHPICAGCARQLVNRMKQAPAICPFCRSKIKGFRPALGSPCRLYEQRQGGLVPI